MDIWKERSEEAKKHRWQALWAMEDLPRPIWFIPASPALALAFVFPDIKKRPLNRLFRERDLQFRASMKFNRIFKTLQKVWSRDDFVLHLQPQMGVGVYASAFGCEVDFPPDQMPRTHFAIESGQPAEKVYELKKPTLRSGLLGDVLDFAEYFNRKAKGRYPIAVTDIQGPIDTAYLIWDSCDFMVAMYKHPREVHHLMRLCTDLIIEHVKAQRQIADEFIPAHVPCVYLPDGMGLTVSEDVLALLSPELYQEFSLPYINELSEEFGGVVIHSCGNFEHQLGVLKKVHNLRGINFGVSETRFEAVWEAFGGKTVVIPHCTSEVIVARYKNALEWIEYVLQTKTHNRGLALQVIPAVGDVQKQSLDLALGKRPDINKWQMLTFGRDVRRLVEKYK